MWIRMGHFVSAWTQFLAKSDQDNWAAQANAEKGKGSAYVMPLVVLLAIVGGAVFAWTQQSVGVQAAILSLGWPVLYIATIAQTVFMLRKLVRRHRGFAV
jgi:biofilm PGA synthesis N-glycosyltransferase PgaC